MQKAGAANLQLINRAIVAPLVLKNSDSYLESFHWPDHISS